MIDWQKLKAFCATFFEPGVLNDAWSHARRTAVVALAITLLIIALPVPDMGSRLSQSLLLAFHPDGILNVDQGDLSVSDRKLDWVFVDTAYRVCGPPEKPTGLCPPSRLRTDPAALAHTLAWVRSGAPSVVIFDFDIRPLIDAPGAADDGYPLLAAELAREDQAPVLLAWSPGYRRDEGPDGPRFVLPENTSPPVSPWRNARYAPAIVTTPRESGGYLTPEVAIARAGLSDERLPTVAFAAALVARTPGPARFAAFDRYPGGATGPKEPDDRTCLPSLSPSCIEHYEKTRRLSSFHDGANGEDQKGEAVDLGRAYLRIAAPAVGEGPAPSERLTNAVVVIGDGRAASGDRHMTIHGEISGSELILGDVRQFTLTPPSPKPGFLGKLWHKVPFLIVGMIAAFLLTWLSAQRRFVTEAKALAAAPPVPTLASKGRDAKSWARVRPVLAAFGYLVAHAGVTGVAILLVLILGRPEPGAAPDFITPWIALGGEVFFEVLAAVAAFVSHSDKEGAPAHHA